MRVKIFSSTTNNIASLEDQVNAWISVNDDYVIKDIKVAFDNNNILMTILHEIPVGSQTTYSLSSGQPLTTKAISAPIEQNKIQESGNFQEMLSAFTKNRPEDKPTNKHPANTNVPTNNIIGGMQEISPSSLKPGRLIQNNYTKYTKSNQKTNEDQAFDWD